MDIGPIVVERGDARSYCGLLTMRDASGEGRVWWSVEALDAAWVRIGFVQGERPGYGQRSCTPGPCSDATP